LKKDTGPIEIIEAGAKGFAKFASKHAVLTAAVTTAGVGGYVAYDNHKDADGANGGAFMKQNVAFKDKRGDLSLKLSGLKEAPKANEPAVEEAPKPETPYLPETAADASYNDTNSNLLDRNGSAAFKTVNFASSGSGFRRVTNGAMPGRRNRATRAERSPFQGRKHPRHPRQRREAA